MVTTVSKHRYAWLAALAVAVSLAPGATPAQESWPERPIRIIVPYSPGGGTDRLARSIASFLPDHLGETPVLVVNRPGAGGILGHQYFLQQPDDGYFILGTTMMPNLLNNMIFESAPYSIDDFHFINAQVEQGFVLCTPPGGRFDSAADLLREIAGNPGSVSTAQNLQSGGHLLTVAMLDAYGLPESAVRLVTFDGGGAPVRAAVAGGQVDFTITSSDGALDSGESIRCIAQFSETPLDGFADVPLVNDVLAAAGMAPLPDGLMQLKVNQGIAVHPGFVEKYPARYEKLVAAYRAMLDDAGYQRFAKGSGINIFWKGPDETNAGVRAGYELQNRYKDLLR
jgi:tripartite-type tricarboxylate transporter receptor subunit TctC